MKTALKKIYAVCECNRGWNAILNHVGKKHPDEEPISMNTVLDAVGLMGAIWCIRTIEGADKEKQEFNEFLETSASIDEIRSKYLELFGD